MKNMGSMPYDGAPFGLSIQHNGPLQWCSVYIRSRRFSSSVTSRLLCDDQDHHSTVKCAFACNCGSVASRNACNRFVGSTKGVPSCAGTNLRGVGEAPVGFFFGRAPPLLGYEVQCVVLVGAFVTASTVW